MDKIEKIQSLLLRSNRVSHKHALTIAKLLAAVVDGHKIGIIWDIGPPVTIHQVIEIVDELRSENLLNSDVITVGVVQEICVLNKAAFLSGFGERHAFVDVTKTLDRPKILSGSDLPADIVSMMHDIREQVKKATGSSVILQVAEDIYCVPTIIGLLAGYPIVYWYKPCDDGEAHCLSGIELQVFRVLQESEAITSFSCPKQLVEEPDVRDAIEAWKKKIDLMKDCRVETVVSKNEFTVNL